MTVDLMLWSASIVGEIACVSILLARRTAKSFPIFTSYLAWALLSDILGLATEHYSPQSYLRLYRLEMPLDSVLQFGVILELAWSVLRPYQAALRRGSIVALGLLILLVGLAVWPLASFAQLSVLPPPYKEMFHLLQTFAILRVLLFLILASCSQLLGIGWRDRELQVATGLGICSFISVGVGILESHLAGLRQFHNSTELIAASYLCSLIYWIFSFMQQEEVRQEFTPRMQNILLTVAGAARANRVALEHVRKSSKR